MRTTQTLMAILAAGALALGGGVALASTTATVAPKGTKATTAHVTSKVRVRRVRGEVTAVEPNAKTLVVKAMRGKQALTVGVDVTDKTAIRRGKAHKTLADIKVGDRVWMKYERTGDKLVAENIHILKPIHVAAKK